MIRSIVRPEKVHEVMKALLKAGLPAVTKMDVFGRGKQRGLKVGEIIYDEMPKEHLLMVIPTETRIGDGDDLKSARTRTKGAFGDGKIFISKSRRPRPLSSATVKEA